MQPSARRQVITDIPDNLTDVNFGRVAKLLETYPGIESRSIVNKEKELYSRMYIVKKDRVDRNM